MKFTAITDPVDVLITAVVLVQVLTATGFILWIWRRQPKLDHRKWNPPPNHLRDRSGFITPELAQAIAGIGLILALGLGMAACFCDEPRW